MTGLYYFAWIFKGRTYFLIASVWLVIVPRPTVNCARVLFAANHTASHCLTTDKEEEYLT